MKKTEFGIAVSHYKAFGEEPQGFDCLRPVNVIIGRNNSGKSSLIDLIEWCCTDELKYRGPILGNVKRHNRLPEVWFTQSCQGLLAKGVPGEPAIDYIKKMGLSGKIEDWRELTPLRWTNVKEFWEVVGIRWKMGDLDSIEIACEIPPKLKKGEVTERARGYLEPMNRNNHTVADSIPISRRTFQRIAAERNILPEPLNPKTAELTKNGRGLTNLLNRFITDWGLPREAVEKTLLQSINRVFEPDAKFTSIQVQRISELYEIFLEEETKQAVRLSDSGSGLQTVLLVLACLDILPQVQGNPKKLSSWVFAFEELENNLHPALQRRLFWLLRNRIVEAGSMMFITTHSPVVIDLFADDEKAQIIHVTHDGECAKATTVLSYSGHRDVLDDLDVRASDLLQANSIVWVEGPTDRKYFNHWIKLWTDGQLREGKDYQCVFYGGRLLSHLRACEPEEVQEDAVKILHVNRNAIVLMDSDRKGEDDDINKTKTRIREEVEKGGGIAWVTAGKEVEHYIPKAAFARYVEKEEDLIDTLRKNGSILSYLNKIERRKRKSYDKVKLADAIIPLTQRADIEAHLDLAERLQAVTNKIREWNRKPHPPPEH